MHLKKFFVRVKNKVFLFYLRLVKFDEIKVLIFLTKMKRGLALTLLAAIFSEVLEQTECFEYGLHTNACYSPQIARHPHHQLAPLSPEFSLDWTQDKSGLKTGRQVAHLIDQLN